MQRALIDWIRDCKGEGRPRLVGRFQRGVNEHPHFFIVQHCIIPVQLP